MADDDGGSLAILPQSMGKGPVPGSEPKRKDPSKFIPAERGGLLLANPAEEESPYTFADHPAYVRAKKAEEQAKRAAELEGKDETRGFLRSVEELGKKQKWEEAFQTLEKRTAVPSGLFLVTRAVLRWKFSRYAGALRDVEDALKSYGSSAKAGPLAAAFASFARICLGSQTRDTGSCSKDMRDLVVRWEEAEDMTLRKHVLGQGLFHPREVVRLEEPCEVIEGMEASDGTYVAATGVRIGYVLLKNKKDASAPVIVHFHGSSETAADYRAPALAEKYRDLPAHLLVIDYRGYGWSGGEPSLATFLRDAEPLAEKLPELFVQQGFAWPYPGGIVLSGRSVGAQVAVHLAAMFPSLFRALMLDSALATSATGDRLGRAPERTAAVECWRRELNKANLDVLLPLDADLWCLSVLDKIRAYDGQLLVLHGLADELVPYDGSESLHAAASTRRKELVLVEGAGHNNIGHFDAYWASIRRLCLRIQLDDSLPSVGPAVEHLCVVCAEKAVSKCGRCQKVWYCGRKHQAEHWKEHKMTCAGGPPEPKPKVEPEGEACLVAAVTAEVCSGGDVEALTSCLQSVGAQDEPVHALYVSWRATSSELADQVRAMVQDLEQRYPALKVKALQPQCKTALSQFEHAKLLTAAMAQDAVPAQAWVALLEAGVLWNSTYAATLVPVLRRAAADQRVIAVSCPRRAQPLASHLEGKPPAGGPWPGTAVAVQEALEAGRAELSKEGPQPQSGDLVARMKVLHDFVEKTPATALAHELCAHRFHYKIAHTYGKKVTDFAPPESEWMRWVAPAGPPDAAADESDVTSHGLTEADRKSGYYLYDGLQKALHSQSTPPAAEESESAAAAEAAPQAPLQAAFASPEVGARAVARLRRAIERKLITCAGESMPAKEMKIMAMEHMNSFLAEHKLGNIIGLLPWARQTAADMSEAAACLFQVSAAAGGLPK